MLWTSGTGSRDGIPLPRPKCRPQAADRLENVKEADQIQLDWTPVPRPGRVTLRGRFVTLEPLDADRHSGALWQAVRGHDDLWTWMPDGPYGSEVELFQSLAEKKASVN